MARTWVFLACLAAGWPVAPAAAQAPSAPAPVAAPRFGITDNSFLVEEAFNQDAGVFQNIFIVARNRDGRWDGSFTQEWPLGGVRHQLSFTLPFSIASGVEGVGDILVNYRFQVWNETDHRPAFAPRVSAVFASQADRRPLGLPGTGWQINLPFSKQVGALYLHANVGATWLKQAADPVAGTPEVRINTPSLAGSVVWAVRPMFHLMLEVYAQSESVVDGPREDTVIVVPGFRTGWNFGEKQIVVGLGAPITSGDARDYAFLTYFSLEMPFVRK